MSEYNHKLRIRTLYDPTVVHVYIDGERVNAWSIREVRKEPETPYDFDLTMERVELRLMDINDIARIMNEETFEKFCKLWREYHECNVED